MYLPSFIAKRYLFAKKSHHVINIISAISAIGMAIGTAALIIILSVYNGFDSLVRQLRSSVEPDFLITPARGKVFRPDSLLLQRTASLERVQAVCGILEDYVYLSYEDRGGTARAKGVDSTYESLGLLDAHITTGDFSLHKGQVPLAAAGAGLAAQMGINPRFLSALELYYPSRERPFSMMNPAASLQHVKIWPSGIFAINDDINKDLLILPIDTMRNLQEYPDGTVSGIEIRVLPGTKSRALHRLEQTLADLWGTDFRIADREHQNLTLYRMMQLEKAAIWLILLFVVVIIAFNIFSSLSMLIIEKEEDIETFRSLGADARTIRRIFILEGWMISLLGMLCGLVVGVVIAWLQQRYGLVRMPYSWSSAPYPVRLLLQDVLLTAGSVALIGWLIALLPVQKYLPKK